MSILKGQNFRTRHFEASFKHNFISQQILYGIFNLRRKQTTKQNNKVIFVQKDHFIYLKPQQQQKYEDV